MRNALAQERVQIVPVNEDTAEFYALIFAQLRRKGKPIPTNDLWIAATTLENGVRLATSDEHFKSIDGIIIVDAN